MALGMAKVPAKRWKARADLYQQLVQARLLVETSPEDAIRLVDAADAACLSKHHFHRMFREVFGETPHQLRTRLRLERARTLLAESSLTVAEIALEAGCQTPSSFARLFSRHFGETPSAYRLRCGGQAD